MSTCPLTVHMPNPRTCLHLAGCSAVSQHTLGLQPDKINQRNTADSVADVYTVVQTGRNAAAAATPEPNGTCAAEASTTATDATCEAGTATAEAKTVASKGHAGGALTTLALPVTEVLDLKTFTLGSALWPAYRTAF